VQLVTRNNNLAGWLAGLVASDVIEELEKKSGA
jgi:hypothetical protein